MSYNCYCFVTYLGFSFSKHKQKWENLFSSRNKNNRRIVQRRKKSAHLNGWKLHVSHTIKSPKDQKNKSAIIKKKIYNLDNMITILCLFCFLTFSNELFTEQTANKVLVLLQRYHSFSKQQTHKQSCEPAALSCIPLMSEATAE